MGCVIIGPAGRRFRHIAVIWPRDTKKNSYRRMQFLPIDWMYAMVVFGL